MDLLLQALTVDINWMWVFSVDAVNDLFTLAMSLNRVKYTFFQLWSIEKDTKSLFSIQSKLIMYLYTSHLYCQNILILIGPLRFVAKWCSLANSIWSCWTWPNRILPHKSLTIDWLCWWLPQHFHLQQWQTGVRSHGCLGQNSLVRSNCPGGWCHL